MSTSSNNTTAQLKQQIADGTEHTKTYLDSLKESIATFDKEHKLTDTASSYLQAGIDQADWSVNELKNFGAKMQNESNEVSDEVVTSTKAALAKMRTSLDDIKAKAVEYDQKAKKDAETGAENAKSSLESLIDSAKNQGASFYDSIASTLESMQKQISAGAASANDSLFNAATAAKNKATETDPNTSGSVATDLYNKTAEIVNQGVEYVSSAFKTDNNPATGTKP